MRILLGPLWLRFAYWSVVGAVVVVLSTSLSSSSSSQPLVTRWPLQHALLTDAQHARG